jgi:hypothetical protein
VCTVTLTVALGVQTQFCYENWGGIDDFGIGVEDDIKIGLKINRV